jgi:hypothetical protein
VKGEWDLVFIASNLKFSVEEKMWEKSKSIYSQIEALAKVPTEVSA